jgi:flagellar hook-associated protein 3 FlgL
MRVATDSYINTAIQQINSLSSQMQTLENEATTGLSVQAPSDNPEAMESTLNDLSSQAAQQQYSNSISTLQSQGNVVYSALQSLQTIVSQAQNIATEAGSATNSQTDLNNYASEVGALIQQALQIANTKDPSTGQYLFGGTNSGEQPFTATNDANGNVTAVAYQGNTSVNQTEIAPGVTVSVDVPGANTTGSGSRGLITDSQTGADLFNHLIALQNDLSSGNTSAATGTDAQNLQKDENNVTYQVAYNGNVQTRLNTAASTANNQATSLDTTIANTSGANIVQVTLQMNQVQEAYTAALEATSKVLQVSMVDFLS